MLVKGLRLLFFALIVRPVIHVLFGVNVRHRERLPAAGPALVVANHNSHLDTMALMSLFPLGDLPKVRPVAAADYFTKSGWMAWFSLNIIGIVPLDRDARKRGEDPLAGAVKALEEGNILILFPEGTRGQPEEVGEFKKGVAHLVERHPVVRASPVYLHGFGKVLPKGARLPIPFFLDVFVGEPVAWQGDHEQFVDALKAKVLELGSHDYLPDWL